MRHSRLRFSVHIHHAGTGLQSFIRSSEKREEQKIELYGRITSDQVGQIGTVSDSFAGRNLFLFADRMSYDGK